MNSKKVRVAVVAGAILCALAIVYFLLLSPKSTEVEFKVAEDSMSSTEPQVVSGSVSPVQAGRLVIVQLRGDGEWDEVARTSTDATGVYEAEFPMTGRGAYEVRVRVEEDGRQESVTSKAEAVTVLSPTQVQAQISKFARTDRPLRISGRVGPAAKRQLTIEGSVDGQEWTTVGSGSSQPNGKFAVSAKGFAPGKLQLKVVVAESDTDAAAETKARTVNVEDYKSAGRKYLQIVTPVNELLDQFNDVADANDLVGLKAVSAKLAQATTKQAKAFRDYAYWPQEVKRQIELLGQAGTLEADYYNRVARTDSLSDAYAIDYSSGPAGADDAPVVIRSALGLPKRD